MAFGPYGYKPPGKFKSLEVKGPSDLDGAVNVNDSGEAVDFRVEGDDETHALFVQGSSSNVGIHVSNPSTALEIDGDVKLTPTAISTAHISSEGSLKVQANNGLEVGTNDADSVKIGRTNTALAKVHLRSGDVNDLVVSDSKVGIGTDSPTTKLQVTESNSSWAANVVNGSSGSGLEINSGSTSSHSALKVTNHDGTVEFMRIKGDGNTGIGLSSPKTKLTVEGAVTLKEQAAADADTAAYGQLWVKTATPNELYFTTDAGDDIQLTSGTHIAAEPAEDATTSSKGIASFSSDNFAVSSGAVTIKSGGVDLSDEVTGTLPVDHGGTGATSLTDKSVMISQDSGTDTLTSLPLTGSGEIVIGGASGPAAATLTAGSNVTITNGDGSITIAASGGGGGGAVASVANGANNRIATFTSSDDLNGEANLEFDGTDLSIAAAGKLEFRDSGIYAQSDEDGHLAIVADGHVTTSGFPSNENNIGTSATSLPSIYAHAGDATGEKIGYLTTTGLDALTVGLMYYLSDDPGWHATSAVDADEGAGDLIAIALNTNAAANGGSMLLRGLIRLDSGDYVGVAAVGKTAYMSEGTTGKIDFDKPATSGNIIRVVGHCVQKEGNDILFYFNPSNDYVELA